LDEQVAKKRCLHSVITVQSPNRGSPVASAKKINDVSRAFIAIALSLPKWLPPDFLRTPGTVSAEYQAGVPVGTYGLATALAPLAHDFIIPSASQVLIPAPPTVPVTLSAHLGNLVNPIASHLTGATRWPDQKLTDEVLVVKLINKLRDDVNAPPFPPDPIATV
jgi:hypothetical protein